jgi:GT2 family glycosyltransferase
VAKTVWNSTFRKLKLYLSRKTNSIHFKYFVKDVLILRAECMKDLGVMADSKLYFHCHVDFVYSQALRKLGLIRCITYNFSSLDSLVVLYITLIRSKPEYASVV